MDGCVVEVNQDVVRQARTFLPTSGGRGPVRPAAVPTSSLCDGAPDCADGSDEHGCTAFNCGNGEAVSTTSVCDGFEDCTNGMDEQPSCPTFQCSDGTTVPQPFECDGQPDCADGRDETNCPDTASLQCPN